MSQALTALGLVRSSHTAIYAVMSLASLLLLYVAIGGWLMIWLRVILPLLTVDILVFAISGLKCPLTALVDRCAGATIHVPDTYLPERLTRHTLAIFGPILPVVFIASRGARERHDRLESMPALRNATETRRRRSSHD